MLARILGPTFVVLLVVTACSVEKIDQPKLRPNAPTDAGTDVAEASAPPSSSNDASIVDTGTDSAPVEVYVSDMNDIEVVANGYGPLEKNTSNGEDQAGDGVAIMIGGIAHAKGLGVHAASEVNVPLGGNYTQFLAEVGIDDEVMDNGSVVFQVIVDGATLYDSGVVTGADLGKLVSVDVTGKQQLKLVVTDGGDGLGSDHADWGSARLRQK